MSDETALVRVYTVWTDYLCLGVYQAATEAEALDQMACRNRYRCYADIPPGASVTVYDEHEAPWNSHRATALAVRALQRQCRRGGTGEGQET